ncbi:MAG TPA: SDR family oxidoreductase [Bryobacteraceae bacterium]|nr:SDR family oxidoreductase [Bryobacteraceae bacterium]
MSDLTNKIAVVTAAAQGIGRASTEAFARAGIRVIATDINEERLGELTALPNITLRKLDVTDTAAVRAFAAQTGPIDILFNCAGVVHNGTILDTSELQLDQAFDLNVKGMYRMVAAFLPGMLEKGDGCIINMSSVCSSVKGVPNRFAYGTTKAAVIGLTKSIAADYVSRGIRCNAICPGTVDTPSLHERLRATGDFEKAFAAFTARQPIGRLGQADEIADLVLYLATAAYTNGQIHVIDGGWTA